MFETRHKNNGMQAKRHKIQLPITNEAFKACSPRIFWNIVNFCFFCYLELCHKQCQFTSKDSVSPIGLGKLSPVIQTLRKTEYLSETKSNNLIMGYTFLVLRHTKLASASCTKWLCATWRLTLRHVQWQSHWFCGTRWAGSRYEYRPKHFIIY